MKSSNEFIPSELSGRNRRLLNEWRKLEERLQSRSDISCQVLAVNTQQLPISYLIDYHQRSICSVEHLELLDDPTICHKPLFADHFIMQIDIPDQYPCVDAPPAFHFLTTDTEGHDIAHPWHPNIRFFGDMAGRVCINMADSYTDLVWGVERVMQYLRYERYHAIAEPPYPEDMKVAIWVLREGEPNEWLTFWLRDSLGQKNED